MVAKVIAVEDFDLVIFGGSGDLARRKILPALYRRRLARQMPETARIIAAAHSSKSNEDFRSLVREALETFLDERHKDKTLIEAFLEQCSYVQLDAFGDDGWKELQETLRDDVIRSFYFSVAPSLFAELSARLTSHSIATEQSRLVVEKPFGHDLPSAKALNAALSPLFRRGTDLPD